MNIMITGGAGYIGTRLSNNLALEGHKVTVVDLFLVWGPLNRLYKETED